jgi:hypothetical protein
MLHFVHSIQVLSLNQTESLFSGLSECQVELGRYVGSLAVLRRVDNSLPDAQLVRRCATSVYHQLNPPILISAPTLWPVIHDDHLAATFSVLDKETRIDRVEVG